MFNQRVLKVSIAALAISAAAFVAAPAQPDENSAQGPPPASVQTARAELGSIVQSISLTGTVEGYVSSALASEQEGIVETMHVLEGAYLEKDEPIASLRQAPFRLRLAEAQAQAQADRQRLLELENGMREEERSMTRARYDEAKRSAEIARSDFERYERLLADGNTSQSEYDRVKRSFVNAEATEIVAKAEFDMMERGARQEVLEAARAQAAASEAAAALAQDALERSTIRAPYAGAVTMRHVNVGDWVGRGDRVADFEALDKLRIQVNVPEQYFPSIQLGDTFQIRLDAFPKKTVTAVVSQKVPRADAKNRTFSIYLETDNPERTIAPGMLARMELLSPEAAEKSVIVLRDALVPQGPMLFVYKAQRTKNGVIAVQVPVRPGRFFGTSVEVFGDLAAGDEVVIRGNERVQPGQPLILNSFVVNPMDSADRVDPTGFFKETERNDR